MVGCLDNAVGVLDIVDVVGRLADFLGFADRNRMVSQNPHLRGEAKTIVIVFRSKAPPPSTCLDKSPTFVK